MPVLRTLKISDVLRHAGLDPTKLSHQPAIQAPAWVLTTPVVSEIAPIEQSRFYQSIRDHVNDSDKKSHFLTMFLELSFASRLSNYQEAIKGSAVSVKEAHSFKYQNANHKLWELKHGKKDRVYFFSLTVKNTSSNVIVLLKTYHKKDRNTPDEVKNYCESTMKEFLRAGTGIKIIRS